MFKFLQLSTGEYWQILLFKDIQNYCGIQESNPEKMFMEMNIVRHLPESVRHKFKFTVMELLTKTLKFNRKLALDKDFEAQVKDRRLEQRPSSQDDQYGNDGEQELDHEEICKMISESFSAKLLQHLEDILQFRKKALLEAQSSEEEESDQEEEYGPEDGGQEHMEQQEHLRLQRREKRQKELTKWDFPQCIGSYNSYSVPALEFTKMICNHVFGLDPAF